MPRIGLSLVVGYCCIVQAKCWNNRPWVLQTGATCGRGTCLEERNAECNQGGCLCNDHQCTHYDQAAPGVFRAFSQGGGYCQDGDTSCPALEVKAITVGLEGPTQDSDGTDEVHIRLFTDACQGCQYNVVTRATTLTRGQEKGVHSGGRWINAPVQNTLRMTVWERDIAFPDRSKNFELPPDLLQLFYDGLGDGDDDFIYLDAKVAIRQTGLTEMLENVNSLLEHHGYPLDRMFCLSPETVLVWADIAARHSGNVAAQNAVDRASSVHDAVAAVDEVANEGNLMESLTYCPFDNFQISPAESRDMAYYNVKLQIGKAKGRVRRSIGWEGEDDTASYEFIYGTMLLTEDNFDLDREQETDAAVYGSKAYAFLTSLMPMLVVAYISH